MILFYIVVSSGPKDDSELDYKTLKGAGEGPEIMFIFV